MDIRTAAVFGGSGKIGQQVIAYLESESIHVRALEHNTPVKGRSVNRIVGSIKDMETVRKVIDGADVVLHMATTKEDKDGFFDVTMRGTINILEACREHKVKQVVLLGGDAVFGIWFYPQPIPIDENHPYEAYPGYYAFTKVMEETMARQYSIQYGIPVTILRSSWVFDQDDILNHLSLLKNVNPKEEGHGFGVVTDEVRKLIEAGEERIPILVNKDGVPLKRHIVHIDDVIQGLSLLLGNPVAIGESFNIAAPAPFSYDVAAKQLANHTGMKTIELVCPDYHSFEIDINKARSMLGYRPAHDIFAIIDRGIAYRSI